MVGLLRAEDLGGVGRVIFRVLLGNDAEAAVRRPVERNPLPEHVVTGELVELADELPGLEVQDRVALLEGVELLQDSDGDRDVVLLEALEGVPVVEDDRGV